MNQRTQDAIRIIVQDTKDNQWGTPTMIKKIIEAVDADMVENLNKINQFGELLDAVGLEIRPKE